MRYIDNTGFVTKYGVKKPTEPDYWRNDTLRKDIKELFNRKCWYTEAKMSGSDMHVDHYRPKARISQYKTYDYNGGLAKGYDWLRNDSSNYRAACAYANRGKDNGGKHDYFPLLAGSPHITHKGDYSVERPILLDPCKQEDVTLISFNETGEAIFKPAISADDKVRVEASIDIYNINHYELVEDRLDTWHCVLSEIDTYRSSTRTQSDKDKCVKSLKNYINKKMAYSGCAIACVIATAPLEIKELLGSELIL